MKSNETGNFLLFFVWRGVAVINQNHIMLNKQELCTYFSSVKGLVGLYKQQRPLINGKLTDPERCDLSHSRISRGGNIDLSPHRRLHQLEASYSCTLDINRCFLFISKVLTLKNTVYSHYQISTSFNLQKKYMPSISGYLE